MWLRIPPSSSSHTSHAHTACCTYMEPRCFRAQRSSRLASVLRVYPRPSEPLNMQIFTFQISTANKHHCIRALFIFCFFTSSITKLGNSYLCASFSSIPLLWRVRSFSHSINVNMLPGNCSDDHHQPPRHCRYNMHLPCSRETGWFLPYLLPFQSSQVGPYSLGGAHHL